MNDDDESEFENEILSEEIEELSQVLEESWLDTRYTIKILLWNIITFWLIFNPFITDKKSQMYDNLR